MYSVETASTCDWNSPAFSSIFIPKTTLVRAARLVFANAARLGHKGEIWREDGTRIGYPRRKRNLPK